MAVRAIILAGGAGTRFWPLSRNEKPKQLLALNGKESLLEQTINRNKPLSDSQHISTGENLKKAIEKHVPKTPLIVEPSRRDTAAAVGLCATRFDDDDVLLLVSSDHLIKPQEAYEDTMQKAIALAQQGAIVVVGIPPRYPSTGYGYIKPAANAAVQGFTEKPDRANAKRFVDEGYLWNAGITVAKAGTILSELKAHAPDIHDQLISIRQGADLTTEYDAIRKTSFDYAVLEKASNVKYVKASFYWSDLGSFDSLQELHEGENVSLAPALYALDSKGNVVVAEKPVALIDCQDLVVVQTKDAILVCPKNSSEKTKKLQELLPDELK
jgi:mannose-1-phosphate guanylyltransferase/mannose-6-phosphate isomerase